MIQNILHRNNLNNFNLKKNKEKENEQTDSAFSFCEVVQRVRELQAKSSS